MPAGQAEQRDASALALEYAIGTLRGAERRRFAARLESDASLRPALAFWEEQLMAINPGHERPPAADTWQKIAQRLGSETGTGATATGGPQWTRWWQWLAPTAAAALLLFALIGYQIPEPAAPNTDYVAVLADGEGKALLTALTTAEHKRMWLKWEKTGLRDNTSAQLWAISKRDGAARPIAVFSDTQAVNLSLDQARWRLVTDAAFLLLTEEEPGGSAIDEPSEVLLAKGACVRFAQKGDRPI